MSQQSATIAFVLAGLVYAGVGAVLLHRIRGMTTMRAILILGLGALLLGVVYARFGLRLGWWGVALALLAGVVYGLATAGVAGWVEKARSRRH